MKKLLSVMVVTLLLLVTPLTAQEDFRIANVDNAVVYNGVYVGAYTGQLIGMPYFDAYCVDFLHYAHVGRWLDVNITSIDDASLSNTRWGQYFDDDVSTRIRYRTAAYLASQFAVTSYGSNNVNWGQLHTAMWRTFTPWAPQWEFDGAVGSPEDLIAGAVLAQDTMDLSDWVIVSDVTIDENGRRGTQEFMARRPMSPVPEPATVFLIGSGLLGLGIIHRRKKNINE